MGGLSLVTVPEGLTRVEITARLAAHLGVPAAAFDSLAQNRAFLDSLGIAAPTLEGFLAPDSYEFLPGTAPEVAFRRMVEHRWEELRAAAAGRDSLPLGLSLYQLLTLASIVDAEAQVNDERPRIARVYLNRIERHMRLQADPTVAYGLGMSPRSRLYFSQLVVATPYNTYLIDGLPPGPICNPGRRSIEAVLDATLGSRELFFVARGDGRHLFAETFAQHERNISHVRAPRGAATPPGGERPRFGALEGDRAGS